MSIRKHKKLIVVLSSILFFVVLVSSCIANEYSYYFDAMKAKKIFFNNKEKFEYVVEYLLSKDLELGEKLEFDTVDADSAIYETLVSIGSPHIYHRYYRFSTGETEHRIGFDLDLRFSTRIEYSSIDYQRTVIASYVWGTEKLSDNWYLYYETLEPNRD